jgi:AraC-like DNA-binding protein
MPSVRRIVRSDVFRRLCEARELIHDAWAEELPVPQLADRAGMSPYHFVRTFAHVFGATPHRYLTRVRLERAKGLLASGACSVTEACFEVGFSSLGSFSTLFRRETGRSPREFQRHTRSLVVVPAALPRLYIPHCFFSFYGPTATFEKPSAGPGC